MQRGRVVVSVNERTMEEVGGGGQIFAILVRMY